MPNHYHLLLETPNPNLHNAMQLIDGRYTQSFNKKYTRDGPLFKGRYKSIVVQKEEYFLELVRYIHLNGTKALIFPNPRQDAFSSHRWYLFPREGRWWHFRDAVLDRFSTSKNPANALDEYVAKGIRPELEKKLNRKRWPPVLGTKDFINVLKVRYVGKKSANNECPQKTQIRKQTGISPAQIDTLIHTLSSNFRVTDQEKTWILMYLLKHICELSYAEIAVRTGRGSYSAVHKYLTRKDFKDSILLATIAEKLKGMSNVQI